MRMLRGMGASSVPWQLPRAPTAPAAQQGPALAFQMSQRPVARAVRRWSCKRLQAAAVAADIVAEFAAGDGPAPSSSVVLSDLEIKARFNHFRSTAEIRRVYGIKQAWVVDAPLTDIFEPIMDRLMPRVGRAAEDLISALDGPACDGDEVAAKLLSKHGVVELQRPGRIVACVWDNGVFVSLCVPICL